MAKEKAFLNEKIDVFLIQNHVKIYMKSLIN